MSDHHARDGSSSSSGYGRLPSMYKGYEKYWLGLLGSKARVFLDSDTAVRRYGLNTGLGFNVRLKEICSTSRNLHPLELGQNGANSRP